MAAVYKHTNKINGKCYIGIVLGDRKPKSRWGNGTQYKSCVKFYNAIKKYGWDGFYHDILFINLTDKEAKEKEIELIKKYNSIKNGYNITEGGSGSRGRKCSNETKEKIRKKRLGTHASIESRKRMSESQNKFRENLTQKEINDLYGQKGNKNGMYGIHRFGESNPFYGKHHTEETRKRLSILHKNIHPKNKKAVNQYDLKGNFIKSYDSISNAAKENGCKNYSHISQCCTNKRKSAYGYIWRFKTC